MCVYTHMQAHMAAHTKKPQQSYLNRSGAEEDKEPLTAQKTLRCPLKSLEQGPLGTNGKLSFSKSQFLKDLFSVYSSNIA